MPTVTRNTLWFDGFNGPYVDFEVKGLQVFFGFKKSLTYCIPDGRSGLAGRPLHVTMGWICLSENGASG
jgi:hypothetical protein